MAKQSFSVGQVLTAAQMNSLQQTAMLGGSAIAKTASYTLVAADAGTVVSVNSTSATTITVNTGLFSAGDTVTIQNWGSGAVTITAGTATVNTAGSLIVPQYDGGVLYFTSASAAIYFDFVQAGAVSPLTTKGDLYGFGTSDARIPIGTNGHILTADSTQSLGLKWAAAASGGGMTLLSTTTLSGASTTISSISGSYKNLYVEVENISNASAANQIFCIPNNSTSKMVYVLSTTSTGGSGFVGYRYVDDTNINLTYGIKTFGDTNNFWSFNFYNYASSTTRKTFDMIGGYVTSGGNENSNVMGYYNENTAISSLVFTTNGGNWAGGTVRVYGVN